MQTNEPGQKDPSQTPGQDAQLGGQDNANIYESINQNQGKPQMSQMLSALFVNSNLVAQNSMIPEVKMIAKSLEDAIEDLKKQVASPEQMAALPSTIQHLTSEITRDLPGITLAIKDEGVAYVMPVLFYKAGVTDATDTVVLSHGEAPRGFAKAASTFMNREMLGRVVDSFGTMGGKKTTVNLVSPHVINLERYIKQELSTDDMVREATNAILGEWQAGLLTMGAMLMTKAGVPIPSPFKGGKLFGAQDSAVARVEAVYHPVIKGSVTPYNLAVSIVTANKNGFQNQGQNQNNTRTVCKTYLNVQLEALQQQQFQMMRMRAQGRPVQPLVPVISIGTTQAGEILNKNESILSAALGLFAALTANSLRFFSEGFRDKAVGHRGNLGNFNHYLMQALPGVFTNEHFLAAKNIQNVSVVNDWIQRFVNERAVYVSDVPLFGPESALSDFWLNLVQNNVDSTYVKTFVAILDALTDKKFSKLATENSNLGKNRAANQWAYGDKILNYTNGIRPRGIAQGKDGKWFDLGQIDGMFLRQSDYYGTNEQAVAEYQALVDGTMPGMDQATRQFNITNKLQQLFQNNVRFDGWDTRLFWSSSLFATLAEAMGAAGTLTVNSANHGNAWTMEFTNDLLEQFMSASVAAQGVTPGMNGYGMYTNYN